MVSARALRRAHQRDADFQQFTVDLDRKGIAFAKYYYEQGHLAGDQDAAQYAALQFEKREWESLAASPSRRILISMASTQQWKVFNAANEKAAALGHKLDDEWIGGAHGYHTICTRCGGFVGVKITHKLIHGSASEQPCKSTTPKIRKVGEERL